MRAWVYLVSAAVGAVGVAVFALLRAVGSGGGLLWIGAVAFLALAVFLFFWDAEKDEVFVDDWTEAGQAAAGVASAAAGLLFLVAYFVA